MKKRKSSYDADIVKTLKEGWKKEEQALAHIKTEQVKKIFVPSCTSFSSLNCCLQQHKIDTGLYNHFITSLGRNSFIFSSPIGHVTYLVSGTIPYLNEQSKWIRQKKGIFVTDSHTRFRRGLPKSLLGFQRLTHTMVGGATTFEVVYAYTPIMLTPQFTSLRRRVGDFMDHSLPPTSIVPISPAISHTMLLPVQHLTGYIHFPTHFSHNGFGCRQLTPKEQLALFGLPSLLTLSTLLFP